MSYGLLFSGQGTQHADMLPWLAPDAASGPALQTMARVLCGNWRAGLADSALRSSNAYAQPLIVGTSLAAWAALHRELGQAPAAVAGYSVGELAAFACAGVFAQQTAIELAVQRAALMDAAVCGLETGLLSVSGMRAQQVLQAHAGLDCAIALGADQGIYAGTLALLQDCAAALRAQGAVCKLLDVRVASHARWMDSAASGFAAQLAALPFMRPQAALVLNATGSTARDPQALRDALAAQIANTVQWAACMDSLAEQGVACVMEIGAGTTLSKMWNQRHPDIPARSIDEFRDAAGAARWLQRNAA